MYSKLVIKGVITTIFGLFCEFSASAQALGFVQQDVIKTSGVINDGQVNSLIIGNIQTSRTYYDGLGRPIQSVAMQASPTSNRDVIQVHQYNNLGQEVKSSLPYVDNNLANPYGSYRPAALTDQLNYYATNSPSTNKVASDQNPFRQSVFENSPLARLLDAGTEGNGFQPLSGYYKVLNYRSNTTADAVIQWGADGSYISAALAANKLSVVDGTNEDGKRTLIFKDNLGNVVLKREMFSPTNLDTYYIYNNAGMIRYIIPPRAVAIMKGLGNYSITQPGVNNLVFQFVYDNLGRVVQKTIPGAAPLFIIYDPLNRPLLMQDGGLRNANQWNYIKYDAKGRTVSQGIYVNNNSYYVGQANMQNYVNSIYGTTYTYETRSAVPTTGYYSNNCFPTVNYDLSALEDLAYSYYDDYDLDQDVNHAPDYSYTNSSLPGESAQVATPFTRGMQTMVRKRTVGSGLSNIWLINVIFYDRRGNTIQVKTNNQLNYTDGKTVTDTKTVVPDFTGKPLISRSVKVTSAYGTANVITSYTYDSHNTRLSSISQSYNNGTSYVGIASYTYNEMGQLVIKSLGKTGSGTYLQNLDYRYNIHGQLISINNSTLVSDVNTSTDLNDIFGMQIMYDQPDITGAVASHSGRISEVKWMARNTALTRSNERSYIYKYDQLNRVTDALYADRPYGTTPWGNQGAFDEKNIVYDENGNITKLKRNALPSGGSLTTIDDLTYTYSATGPNQLLQVVDGTGNSAGFNQASVAGQGYFYDPNSGNLVTDNYKGLALTYNELNRTKQITMALGQSVSYTYDASGAMIRKVASGGGNTTTTDYIDGFVYVVQTNGTTNGLAYFSMPEGRVTFTINGSIYTAQYVITDQQGNARVTFQDSGSGTVRVMQENSYYAFGMIMQTGFVNPSGTPNINLYNGQSEWQKDFTNLPDYYQTFNRNYDASLGRWLAIDPKADAFESMSPYQYSGDNPILNNDPLGDDFATVQEFWDTVSKLWHSDFGGTATGPGGDEIQYYNSTADAVDSNQLGSFFSVNQFGFISSFGHSYSKMDVLFSTDKNGDVQMNNYTLVDQGILESGKKSEITDGTNTSYDINWFYVVSNEGKAVKLFEWLASNTSVEWSLVQANKNGYSVDIIGTTHMETSEWFGGAQARALQSTGWDVTLEIHDHPFKTENILHFLWGPSGYLPGDMKTRLETGDKKHADEYLQEYPFSHIIFEVYDVFTHSFYKYGRSSYYYESQFGFLGPSENP